MHRFLRLRPWGVREQRLDTHGIEAVRTVAELAGYGHRTLFPQHLAHLLRAERPQETGDPALTATAFEAHRGAAEQPQVVAGKAPCEKVFDAALPQPAFRAQLCDPALGADPRFFHRARLVYGRI